jgi:hypothetical protein
MKGRKRKKKKDDTPNAPSGASPVCVYQSMYIIGIKGSTRKRRTIGVSLGTRTLGTRTIWRTIGVHTD